MLVSFLEAISVRKMRGFTTRICIKTRTDFIQEIGKVHIRVTRQFLHSFPHSIELFTEASKVFLRKGTRATERSDVLL